MANAYTINVGYDETHFRYFVQSSDIPGLNVEAETFKEMEDLTRDVLLEFVGEGANGSTLLLKREVAFSG